MTNYYERKGGYADAYADVLANGGQLFPGNGRDSANVVVRGRDVTAYWLPNSRRLAEVRELARYLGIAADNQTGGRIARWLIDNAINLPYQETFWNKKWQKIAINGQHWHYCMVAPGQDFMGAEFDLKSAYFSSLSQFKTLLYQEGKGYLDDGGALDSLKVLMPNLPKWFRLQLIGALSSWNMSYLCRAKNAKEGDNLVNKRIMKISYGAAFNCIHRAILRNYKIMQKVHQIGGEHIKRMHTDSFFLSWECPTETEKLIFDYLQEKGCEVAVKGHGRAFFFDLNTGWIGEKAIGSAKDVKERIKDSGIIYPKDCKPQQVVDRFGNYLASAEKAIETYEAKKDETYWGKQLEVIPT